MRSRRRHKGRPNLKRPNPNTVAVEMEKINKGKLKRSYMTEYPMLIGLNTVEFAMQIWPNPAHYSQPSHHAGGGGRKRLPKFKFSAKFPIGLHVILQIQIKKNRKWLLSYVKNYFNRKSVEVQPCTPLEIMLNGFCLKIYGNTYAVHVTVAYEPRKSVLPHWI